MSALLSDCGVGLGGVGAWGIGKVICCHSAGRGPHRSLGPCQLPGCSKGFTATASGPPSPTWKTPSPHPLHLQTRGKEPLDGPLASGCSQDNASRPGPLFQHWSALVRSFPVPSASKAAWPGDMPAAPPEGGRGAVGVRLGGLHKAMPPTGLLVLEQGSHPLLRGRQSQGHWEPPSFFSRLGS